MRIPVLNELPAVKDNTEEFKGYNHNLRTEPGEWFDMKNMTTDYYPVASPRGKRSLQQAVTPFSMVSVNSDSLDYIEVKDAKGCLYFDNKLFVLRTLKSLITQYVGAGFYSYDTGMVDYRNSKTIECSNITVDKIQETFLWAHYMFTQCEDTSFVKVGDYVDFSYVDWQDKNKIIKNCYVYSVDDDAFSCIKSFNEPTFSAEPTRIVDSGTVTVTVRQNKEEMLNLGAMFDGSNNDYRSLVRMGSYICTFPDGVVYETENTDEDIPIYSIMQKTNFSTSDRIKFETVIKSDEKFEAITLSPSTYRLQDKQIQKYLENEALWVNQITFVRIYKQGSNSSFDMFSKGDTVNIKFGSVYYDVSQDPYIQVCRYTGGIFDEKTKEANLKIIEKGTMSINATDDTDYIIVAGYVSIFKGSGQGSGQSYGSYHIECELQNVEAKRKMPEIKLACESQNRIWACSKDGHEIYASALGDPYNFYDYSGLATDSYAVNVGTYGEFTACINYLGRPLFFKENALHSISGSYPSNLGELDGLSFAVTTTTEFKGVEKGSERSLAIIDNILYYKAAAGIVAFDGANTAVISDALGKGRYKNAVAGAYNNKYYVSMQDRAGAYHLFVYDTELGTWCKEDNTHVLQFINVNNELLYLSADDNKIYSVCDEDILYTADYEKEDNIEWECETGNFGYSYPNNKYLSRFQFRMKLTDGAKASFFIQYDSDGVWHKKGEMTGKGIRTHMFPIVPIRCDHMKIKIVGEGDAKIFSISKILEEGGDA